MTRERERPVLAAFLLAAFAQCCAGSGAGLDESGRPIRPTRIHGWISANANLDPIGPGFMFIEWGQVWGGDFRWSAQVDENGYFERDLPNAGLDEPEFGFHWYFAGFIYYAAPVFLHAGEDNNVNMVLYERYTAADREGLVPLPPGRSGFAIIPTLDENRDDDPIISNPTVTPQGDLVRVELDAFDPNGNLSEQILVGTEFGLGVKMNPPAPVVDNNYPNGRYSVTLQIPPQAGDTIEFRLVADDHDCNNSPPTKLRARVR